MCHYGLLGIKAEGWCQKWTLAHSEMWYSCKSKLMRLQKFLWWRSSQYTCPPNPPFPQESTEPGSEHIGALCSPWNPSFSVCVGSKSRVYFWQNVVREVIDRNSLWPGQLSLTIPPFTTSAPSTFLPSGDRPTDLVPAATLLPAANTISGQFSGPAITITSHSKRWSHQHLP